MDDEDIDPRSLLGFDDLDESTRNRRLLAWLSDDTQRAKLFELIKAERGGTLKFPSRAGTPPAPGTGHATAELITDRETIEDILLLRKPGETYSNKVYSALGDGNFMLELDRGSSSPHDAQKAAFGCCFPISQQSQIFERSFAACQAASIISLQTAAFDLADFGMQSALWFCHKVMGYALKDFPVLEDVLGIGYKALVYQVLGRHFVTDPGVVVEAGQGMAALLARTSELIDAYARDDKKALVGCEYEKLPGDFVPMMLKLARHAGNMNGQQLAIIVLGSIIGTVGNVQAAACIAIKEILADQELQDKAVSLARKYPIDKELTSCDEWKALIQGAFRSNPPIPFLPRVRIDENGKATDVLLALGGATVDTRDGDDPLVWGLPDDAPHWCAGKELAWPLICEIVRQVMYLPGLAQGLDPTDARPVGLKKRWGFICEKYPLTYRRDERIVQTSLNVAMPLKSPAQDSAQKIRTLIRAGAPRIEQALREAKQVHFAWFEIIDEDNACVLHTVYDGPFDAYIQDFALKVGDVFDMLFDFIEEPPPRPVKQFPNEFVSLIKLFDRTPAGGYFFTAYPGSSASQIVDDAKGRK